MGGLEREAGGEVVMDELIIEEEEEEERVEPRGSGRGR